MPTKKHYLIPLITSTYLLLLLVGSLYPFTDWQWPAYENWINSFENTTRYVPRGDFIINFLIYVPLGILVSIQLRDRFHTYLLLAASALLATSAGLLMETLQLFIPSRAHSFIDLSMNASGAFVGALLHFSTQKHSSLGKRLRHIRYLWFKRGRYAELGLVIIALWALSELSPFAPTLDFKMLAFDYNHFTNGLFNTEKWDHFTIFAFALEIFALFLITEFVLIKKNSSLFVFGVFAGIIVYLKLPIADTQLMPEFFWGLMLGIALYFATHTKPQELRTKLVIYALIMAYIINQLNHPTQISISTFNWLPFDSDEKRLNRITELLSIAWVFLALSFFTLSIKQQATKIHGAIGLLIVGAVAFLFEWQQQTLQDASADISDILVAMFAWSLPYFHPEIRRGIR